MKDSRLRKHDLGFIEVADKPSSDELQAYYAKIYYQTNQSNYRSQYSVAERKYIEAKVGQKARIMHKLRQTQSEAGTVLDVGCGEGFAMSYFQRAGWRVEGLDYSSVGIETMNPHLVPFLKTGDVATLLKKCIDAEKRYDLILLNNVLEHVVDPPMLLIQLRHLLADRGVLIVTVPNDFSRYQEYLMEARHIEERFWVVLPDHLAYFNVESLRSIAEGTGYNCNHIVADFPIDWFVVHPGSNYVRDRTLGLAAHEARIQLENLLSENSIDDVNAMYEAMARVGMGRQITAFLTRSS